MEILKELNNELNQIFLNGSKAAILNQRFEKIKDKLRVLAENSAIFQTILNKLENLNASLKAKDLMELFTLINSILATQSQIENSNFTKDFFGVKTPIFKSIAYSKIALILKILDKNSKAHILDLNIKELFESKNFDDIRFYKSYVELITKQETTLRTFVQDRIFPLIGENLAPFIEEKLDLNGDKKDALLFEALYKIKKNDILPLSLQALKSSSKSVKIEAIKTLDSEDILLKFANAKDKKMKSAAIFALAKIDSLKADELINKILLEDDLEYIKAALEISKSNKVTQSIIKTLSAQLSDFYQNQYTIRTLLYVLVKKDDEKSLNFLKSILANESFFESAYQTLNLYNLAYNLALNANPKSYKSIYEIFSKNPELISQKICIGVKFFDKARVFDDLKEDFKKQNFKESLKIEFLKACLNTHDSNSDLILQALKIQDKSKNWDRRFGELFAKNLNSNMSQLALDAAFVYDDDFDSFDKIMREVIKNLDSMYLYFPSLIFAKAIRVDHPNLKFYYKEISKFDSPEFSNVGVKVSNSKLRSYLIRYCQIDIDRLNLKG